MTADIEQARAQLLQRERVYREGLREAAQQVREPFLRIARARQTLRRALPLLPLAAVVVTALVVTVQLRRGSLRPVVLLTTAFDFWRLWNLLNASAGASPRHALTHRSAMR